VACPARAPPPRRNLLGRPAQNLSGMIPSGGNAIRQGPESLPDGARPAKPSVPARAICTVRAGPPAVLFPLGCHAQLHRAAPGKAGQRNPMGPEKENLCSCCLDEQQLENGSHGRIISDEKNSCGRWKGGELENPPCCENCPILYSRWNDQTQSWIPPKLAGIKKTTVRRRAHR